jgi:hypothetical protein
MERIRAAGERPGWSVLFTDGRPQLTRTDGSIGLPDADRVGVGAPVDIPA